MGKEKYVVFTDYGSYFKWNTIKICYILLNLEITTLSLSLIKIYRSVFGKKVDGCPVDTKRLYKDLSLHCHTTLRIQHIFPFTFFYITILFRKKTAFLVFPVKYHYFPIKASSYL